MGVILVSLIVILIRYRMNASAERLAHAEDDLNIAHSKLALLQDQLAGSIGDDAVTAQNRRLAYGDGISAAADAIANAPDKNSAMKAQALIYQGDLNFTLANLPDLPGAATQPSLRPDQSTSDLLGKAEDAYNQVIQTYPNEKQQWVAANFGLAAIAEDRAAPSNDQSQWDKAKHFYQTIIESDPPASFGALASKRLDLLPQISQPMPVPAQTPGGGMLGPALPGGILPGTTLPATTLPSGLGSLLTPSNPTAGVPLLPTVTAPDLSLPGIPTTVPSHDAHQDTVLFPTTTPANP
jgi:hypothetical protein